MIISCVKWGDKFSHVHVNRLYRMCQKNMQEDFTFTCYTEDPTDIDSGINIIPLDESRDLETWWWKLCMFESKTNETNIFFDLDVVIQNDITHFKDYVEAGSLRMVKSYWKPHLDGVPQSAGQTDIKNRFDMNINSSVLIWTGDMTDIWNMFNEDPEYYMMKYKGIDSYLYFHHKDKLTFFPPGDIYSRLYGYDENNHWNTHEKPEPDELYFKEDFNVCIFNGWMRRMFERRDHPDHMKRYLLSDEGYDGFEHYWD